MVTRTTNREPGIGQEALFADPHELAELPIEGLAVSVRDRAHFLANSLDLLAQASMRAGLQEAATKPEHLAEIESRYGDSTPTVLRGAARNEDRNLHEARWQFAWAGGYTILKHSGIVETDEALKIARTDFSDFLGRYAGSENARHRDKFRKQLRRTAGK